MLDVCQQMERIEIERRDVTWEVKMVDDDDSDDDDSDDDMFHREHKLNEREKQLNQRDELLCRREQQQQQVNCRLF